MSHLLQMRGLKLVTMYAKVNNIESHLLQMRGLKRLGYNERVLLIYVASFTDAWIETIRIRNIPFPHLSHLLQMRGLKQ